MRKHYLLITVLMIILAGCKSSNQNDTSPPVDDELVQLASADYEVLLIGNSHSSNNNLPGLIERLIEQGSSGKTANVIAAPGWQFLDDRLNDPTTNAYLTGRQWTHVSLQAQKYSTTGQYWYPTTAAEEWIRRVKRQEATPIMFPEWPRRRNYEEGLRVHELHVDIATRESACVAPIGLAWDAFIAEHPFVTLHAADGNHSNPTGALLTAYVFYQVITNNPVNELNNTPGLGISDDLQKTLRDIAFEVVTLNPPCQYL
ncbi:hypothetical protein [Pleionea sp. CnH1-48]|uniref:hypothetical protein n=1 Tax=Pleionea sp. CnH1-48 TaxID=2954494 RepID=UPI00209820C6|nr:hypothetical protein [Pleionea sp. CnH1-48]MCO7225595.1 hypothetical protein [Pleionea sp. CnH1-48]